MKNKYLFIINPAAGKWKCSKTIPKIEYLVKKSAHLIDIVLTERKGHAREISESYSNHYKYICAVGGDGTINEVVNGLTEDQNAIFGVVPCGSGNDFARTIGLKKSLDDNIDALLKNGKIRHIDVGRIEYSETPVKSLIKTKLNFINSFGIGFDALVADIMKETKYLHGFPLYLLSVFKALLKFKSVQITSHFDNELIDGNKFIIEIGNGKTSGGGFKLNPFAEPGDGYLDACLIDNLSKLRILKELPKSINGNHVKLDVVKTLKFQKAEIECMEPTYIHADGEVITKKAYGINISLEKRKVKVIC